MEKNSASLAGTLYVVATPIGNLQDITFRALDTLKTVDAIIAEDTRYSKQLCKSFGIQKPLHSLHAHNEETKSHAFIDKLLQGQSLALISDAGTPLISDPGFLLVREAKQQGIKVVPIPGCCALITALSAAGVPCDHFSFFGFLPAKETLRKKQLALFKNLTHTAIIYESTHRILECMDNIIELFGAEFRLVLAKELTKSFENILFTSAIEIKQWLLEENAHVKGEFVLIFPALPQEEEVADHEDILRILVKELPVKQAVKVASLITKAPKNLLYKLALGLV